MSQSGGNESWRALQVADAAKFAATLDARRLLPMRLPAMARWAVLSLALCATLGFVPEYRSQDYVQKKQEADIIKESGRQIAQVTKRALAQTPPALEPTRQALQSTEELGVKLDQHPVSAPRLCATCPKWRTSSSPS